MQKKIELILLSLYLLSQESSKSLPFVSGRVIRTKKAHIAKIDAVISALPFPTTSPLNRNANELTAIKAKRGGAIADAPLPTL